MKNQHNYANYLIYLYIYYLNTIIVNANLFTDVIKLWRYMIHIKYEYLVLCKLQLIDDIKHINELKI